MKMYTPDLKAGLRKQPSFCRRLSLLAFAFALCAALAQHASAAIIHVSAGGDFQSALDAAQPGDTIELAAGATFVGPFTLHYKAGAGPGWITIRTDAPDSSLPPDGQRITPAYSSVLPKVVSPDSGEPALNTEPQANHYRFVGVEFRPIDSGVFINSLIVLGDGGPNQNDLSKVPHDLAFDRCYIYAFPTQSLKRGIELNSASTDITNSYIAGFKVVGQDAQAIAGWNGPGPFRIINNYLEGSGENVMFGGALASIPNLVPSDIQVERNYFFKPLSWRESDPSYAGIHWSVKNLFELKNAARVTIDGNVFENNWLDAQVGIAILFTVRGENGQMPWATVEDVQFTNNILRHTASAINILGTDDQGASQLTKRITVRNNLFEDVSGATWCGAGCSSGRLFQVINDAADVTLDHNTAFQDGPVVISDGLSSPGFVYTNNLSQRAGGVIGSGSGEGIPALTQYFPGYVFNKNLIYGVDHVDGSTEKPCERPDKITCYPSNNFYPPDSAYGGTFQGLFANYAGGDYRLASGSPYKSAGTDGKDVGADFDALSAATAGAISGVWGPSQTPYGGSPASVPGTVEAENFDNGGEGVAYHDSDAGNNGGEYRSTDVDIRSKPTASNGYVVFNAVAGEWLEYTVNVTQAGYYEVGATSASRLAGGTYHIEVDGADVTGTLTAPTTGSWSMFQPAGRSGVQLSAGAHVLRLALDTNGVEGIVADFDTLYVNASEAPQTPFNGSPFAVPGTIPASDFDNGGEGVAYHDLTPGNLSGSTYRTSDVDMYDTSVTRLQAGEWLEYTVNVGATANTYAIVAQVGNDSAGGALHVEVDGADVTGTLAVPNTTYWNSWTSAIKTGVSLTAGQHVLRVAVDGDFMGLQSLRVVNTATAQTPYGGSPLALPGTISAGDFDQGGELVSYHDNTAGCDGDCSYRTSDVDLYGHWVKRVSAGEWLEYTVNVASPGTYTLTAQVGSDTGGATFHVEFDGVDVTGPLTFPNTGSWATFQPVTKTGINLSAGQKVMRLVIDDTNNRGSIELGSINSISLAP
jgi:Carbohydrate binding module (family 6)